MVQHGTSADSNNRILADLGGSLLERHRTGFLPISLLHRAEVCQQTGRDVFPEGQHQNTQNSIQLITEQIQEFRPMVPESVQPVINAS
jgi:hypothetical protein